MTASKAMANSNNSPTRSEVRPIVVIPVYTLALDEQERLALRRTLRVLHRHQVAIVCPERLDITPLATVLGVDERWQVARFPAHFFAGREGYNKLMMSQELYSRFTEWDYMLVVQSDVLIFGDRLLEWCRRGYSYVGAPWLPSPDLVSGIHPLSRLVWWMRNGLARMLPGFHAVNLKYRVGNGGFSLRHIATMHTIASEHRDAIERLQATQRGVSGFEDVFWSVTAPELLPEAYRVAPWREALAFSVESHPTTAKHYSGGVLPFGTHAYNRNRREWRQWVDLDDLLANPDHDIFA